jgi:hypothetical protein
MSVIKNDIIFINQSAEKQGIERTIRLFCWTRKPGSFMLNRKLGWAFRDMRLGSDSVRRHAGAGGKPIHRVSRSWIQIIDDTK